MNNKSIGLIILWWCEAIIAVRVLLFSVPVIISKSLANSFNLASISDRFIIVMTITAAIFLLVGIASILGSRHWKVLHNLAVIITLILTIGSLSILGQSTDIVGLYYFSPLILSVVLVVFCALLGRVKKLA